jgi:hypothetical protein
MARRTSLTFFGESPSSAFDLALEKFRACSWNFFDGVTDLVPNGVVYGDFAITRVMNSGVRGPTADDLDLLNASLGPHLARVKRSCALEATSNSDQKLWAEIDALFAARWPERMAMSRISKVMCRKRPRVVPMLDNVVTGFLDRVVSRWRARPEEAPEWFADTFRSWKRGQPSPYIRMIRHDILPQVDVLRDLRRQLAKERAVTGVPPKAPLLRIYEATLFWWLHQGRTLGKPGVGR